jgi:deoxyribodipyrimidine photo-lyase
VDEVLSQLLQGRVSALNDKPARDGQDFVLLWLHGQRRVENNLAYAHAQRRANELHKPLVVYEGLRRDYPYASERFHRFVLEGVAATARACDARGVAYGFFLETPSSPRGTLHRLASRAAVVVLDVLPHFIHPRQATALAARAPCRVEGVDAAGVAPLSMFPRAEVGARTLRPKLLRALPGLLRPIPVVPARVAQPSRLDFGFDPFRGSPDEGVRLAKVSREVPAAEGIEGGRTAGLARLHEFLREGLRGYAEGRNDPAAQTTSGLSAYLHFGHLGAAEVALLAQESEAPRADVEAFVEELLVRRELAYNFVARTKEHDSLEALPGWARNTLRDHERDERPSLPSDDDLENARSIDPLWNAMQRQLVREGRIHGWLRMLWGKTLLLYSRTPEDAYRRMRTFNDKYALDGRDAASAANFLWCFGLHDRPFPERKVFGTVRSMTLSQARKKRDLDEYLRRYADVGCMAPERPSSQER